MFTTIFTFPIHVALHMFEFLASTAKVKREEEDEKKILTVCTTKFGRKYHMRNCFYIKGHMIDIPMDEAKRRGYVACKMCEKSINEKK